MSEFFDLPDETKTRNWQPTGSFCSRCQYELQETLGEFNHAADFTGCVSCNVIRPDPNGTPQLPTDLLIQWRRLVQAIQRHENNKPQLAQVLPWQQAAAVCPLCLTPIYYTSGVTNNHICFTACPRCNKTTDMSNTRHILPPAALQEFQTISRKWHEDNPDMPPPPGLRAEEKEA